MLLGAAALPALATPLAAQARPAPVRVNIPAQPLGDALAQFAHQDGAVQGARFVITLPRGTPPQDLGTTATNEDTATP